MHIALGNDHAGVSIKNAIVSQLVRDGHTVTNHGPDTETPVDFPDIAVAVCQDVVDGKADRGILLCGSGIGACMAANKIAGIRAALCHDIYSAHQSVEHDDANVLCLGAKIVGEWLAIDLLQAFLEAEASTEEDFRRRVAKLNALDG